MEDVTLRREFDTDPEVLRSKIQDTGQFMRSAGFDSVTVDGDRIEIANQVGLATIELTLTMIDEPGAVFAYEQVDGPFESMRTSYRLEPTEQGSELTATTEFTLDLGLLGEILDSTVIRRQRRKELTAQFDALERI
jgi:hypothetical protein